MLRSETSAIGNHASELELLAEFANALADAATEEELYALLGDCLFRLLGKDVIINISSFEPEGGLPRSRVLLGLGPWLEKLRALLGGDPQRLQGPYPPAAQKLLNTGRLSRLEGGVAELAGTLIPLSLIATATRLIGLHDCYLIGFNKGVHCGGVTFVTRRAGMVLPSAFIEACVRLAVGALERRQAEERLRRTRAALEQSSRLARVCGWEKDLRSGKQEWTETSTELLGLDQAESASLETLHARCSLPEHRLALREALAAAEQGRPFDLELLLMSTVPDGSRWVRLLGDAEYSQGGCVRLVGALQDIDARKRSEQSVREAESRFRALVEYSQSIIYTLTLDGCLSYVSPSWTAQLGHASTEVVGKPLADFVLPEDRPQLLSALQDLERGREGVEYRVRHLDGSWQTHRSVLARVEAPAPYFVGNAVDLSARKQLEEALERRILALVQPIDSPEAIRLDELFEFEALQRIQDEFAAATGVGSLITLPDGTPVTRASRFCELCEKLVRGTKLGEQRCAASDAHIGRRCIDGPTVQRCLSAGLWDAGAAITVGGQHVANWLVGQVRDSEHSEDSIRAYAREIGADEEACVAAFRKVPVMAREQFDRVARALFTLAEQLSTSAYQNLQQARFIAALKRAEGERDRLHAQLAHAQKMEAIGRLAGGVAHDFNNMLGIILANTDFALRSVAPDSQTALDLAEVRKAALHSAGLTKQLLAFARKQPVSPRRLLLDDAVAAVLQMLRRLLNESIELSWKPGAAGGFVHLDPHQLEQVLANLCVNARDAILAGQGERPGQGHIAISSSAVHLDEPDVGDDANPGEYLVLEVADDGCGMDQTTLSRLFEPFFTTKELGRGTGLGLSTVEGIVRQNGGHIRVTSDPQRGTCFSLYLPLAQADSPQERLPEAPSTKPVTPPSQRTLLVVEDEEAIRKALKRMLVALGYEVLCADSPLHALQLSAEHPGNIDLLVTDVVMPELNGQELVRRLRAERPGLGCLFVSGYTADIIAHHGVLDDGARFLEKPFTQEELAAKVELCLKSRANRPSAQSTT